MKGSIRLAIGFFLVMGSVGGLDNDGPVAILTALALVGLAIMASGVSAMQK